MNIMNSAYNIEINMMKKRNEIYNYLK